MQVYRSAAPMGSFTIPCADIFRFCPGGSKRPHLSNMQCREQNLSLCCHQIDPHLSLSLSLSAGIQSSTDVSILNGCSKQCVETRDSSSLRIFFWASFQDQSWPQCFVFSQIGVEDPLEIVKNNGLRRVPSDTSPNIAH